VLCCAVLCCAVLCCAASNQGYAEPAAAPDAQQQADSVSFAESMLPDWAAAASGAVPQALPQAVCQVLYFAALGIALGILFVHGHA